MKIENIINLSCFENDLSLDLAKDMTIVFGYNGLGKTSLSRFMKYISNADEELDLGNKIKTKGTDGNLHWNVRDINQKDLCLDAIVYNSDFIEDVITKRSFKENTPDDTGTVIETLSFKEKDEFNNLLEKSKAFNEKISKLHEDINLRVEKRLKEEAKSIKAQNMKLAKPESFFAHYDNTKKTPNIDFENDFKAKQNVYKDIDEDTNINPIPTMDLTSNLKSINNLLQYTENESKISFMDEMLAEKRDWILKGLDYTENEECPFCKQNISTNEWIKSYEEYANSKMSITLNNLSSQIDLINKTMDICNNSLQSFQKELINYKAINENFDSQNHKLDRGIELLEKIKNTINNTVEQKHFNNNKTFSLNEEIKDAVEIENVIKYLNNGIRTLNENMNKAKQIQIEGKRNVLKQSIYPKIKKELDNEIVKLENLKKSLSEIEKEKKAAEQEYREELKKRDPIITLMNDLLTHLNLENYEVSEGFELIHRPSQEYISEDFNHFLSDGEKTAISFALFYCEYKLGLYNDKNLIVIDDPVNSLDYNRIYYIYYLIEELKNDKKKNKILLMTHNHIFFNIISYKYNKENSTIYQINKTESNKHALVKGASYNSIYIDKLKTINSYDKKKKKTFNESERAIIPNHCRYILETLAIFHFPSSNKPLDVLEKDIISINQKRIKDGKEPVIGKTKMAMLFKVVNKGSHAAIENVNDREMNVDVDYQRTCSGTMQIVREYSRNQIAALDK
ncbi:MAG: AAA family ATPase [archaeon]